MDPAPLIDAFRARFGRRPTLGARAPGRVNLIGEHTDYNEGWVLPCAIDRDTVLLAARRTDRRICVASREIGEVAEFDAADPRPVRSWLDHVQGPVRMLADQGIAAPGLDLLLASDVPLGAGLSSSAALGVAVATLLDHAAEAGLGPEGCARIAHRSENQFVGVSSGPMDQLASALGERGRALRIDCRDTTYQPIDLPGERLRLLIVHSGVERRLADGAYNARRAECEAAVAAARRADILPPGGSALRDLVEGDLPALARVLDETALKRARHVITENARVGHTCVALDAGDLTRAGQLLRQGQRSLRDDYEVSVPELDFLCRSADALDGVYGSRLTGAGFGGCTLHLVHPDAVDAVRDAIARAYAERFGREPASWVARPSQGATTLSL